MRKALGALLWLWQLPQNLSGLLASLAVAPRAVHVEERAGARISYCFSRFGGLSLGRYLLVHHEADDRLLRHELGHYRQSRLLGPAYLLVIGLPSMAWALLYPRIRRLRPGISYFSFPTERWADVLGSAAGPRRPE